MTRFKRAILMLLSICLLTCMFPVCIFAAEVVEDEPKIGDQYEDDYFEYRYGQYCDQTSWYNKEGLNGWGVRIKSSVPNTTTSLPSPLSEIRGKPVQCFDNLFSHRSFTTIRLVNWDTHNATSMNRMFFYTNKLKYLYGLDTLDTSNVTDMESMFSTCGVTNLNLTGLDTSKITDMTSMFSGCKTPNLDLSPLDTSNVTNMENMFSNAEIKVIKLGNLDTHNVTNMSKMFENCRADTIDLRGVDTSNVETAVSMFSGYSGEILGLGEMELPKATNLNSMFYDYIKDAPLDLSNFDLTTPNINNIITNRYVDKPTLNVIVRTDADAEALRNSCDAAQNSKLNITVVEPPTSELPKPEIVPVISDDGETATVELKATNIPDGLDTSKLIVRYDLNSSEDWLKYRAPFSVKTDTLVRAKTTYVGTESNIAEQVITFRIPGSDTNIQVNGRVVPITTLDVDLPLNIEFTIHEDRSITIPENIEIKSNSASPIRVRLNSITPVGEAPKIVSSTTFSNWDSLTAEQTMSNIAFKLNSFDVSDKNITLGNIDSAYESEQSLPLKLEVFYGKNWVNTTELNPTYKVELLISMKE